MDAVKLLNSRAKTFYRMLSLLILIDESPEKMMSELEVTKELTTKTNATISKVAIQQCLVSAYQMNLLTFNSPYYSLTVEGEQLVKDGRNLVDM